MKNPSGRNGIYVGIDVGGRQDKGFELAALEWKNGRIEKLDFTCCRHAAALPDIEQMRRLVQSGAYPQLADLTYNVAQEIAANLWGAIKKLTNDPVGIFIDSPSAFSRNRSGHGRLTEKCTLKELKEEVRFQQTPSCCCNQPHRGNWGWLVYGMIAYVAVIHEGRSFDRASWERHLREGTFREYQELRRVVRECFPTATIASLRARRKNKDVEDLISSLSEFQQERQVVRRYLQNGVSNVKHNEPIFDRADALVAALSSLPHARTDFGEQAIWGFSKNWDGAPGAQCIEGAVALVV